MYVLSFKRSIFAEVLFSSQSLMSPVDTRSWRVLSLLQTLKVNCFSKAKCDKDQGCFSWFCGPERLMSSYDFVQFHRMISFFHVDFKCFKLVLWPAFRQKFMTIWSFFTRPGDNHDKKISNCSLTPKLVQAQVFLTFPSTRLPISWFLAKYHSERKGFFVQ